MWILVIIGIILFFWFIGWVSENVGKAKKYEELKPQLDTLNQNKERLKQQEQEFVSRRQKWEEKVIQQKKEIEHLAKEKSEGFPWLAKAYADYFYF